jgi:hypothetical protein
LVETIYNWPYENTRLEEDILWSRDVALLLKDIKSNVREICQYGHTEMVNKHPDVHLVTVKTSADVENMIKRVQSTK